MFKIEVIPIIAATLCTTPTPNNGVRDYGVFYETEPIPADSTSPYRVYIYSEDIGIIHGRGLSVQTKVSVSPYSIRYYYNAYPSTGLIKAVKRIHGDVDSLIYMTSQLENEFVQNYPAESKTKEANSVLAYGRCIKKEYASSDLSTPFEELCGSPNQEFIQKTEESKTHVLRYADFYSSFLDGGSQFNDELFPAVPSEGQTYACPMADPAQERDQDYGEKPVDSIDVPHLFAVMDGCFKDTEANFFLAQAISRNDRKDLISWAGDLQDFAKHAGSKVYNDFASIMNEAGSRFSYSDMAADLDGYNISTWLDVGYHVSNALKQYYANSNFSKRYRFVDFAEQFDKSSPTKSALAFQKRVFEMMHLNLDGSGLVTESGDMSLYKYPIMMNGTALPEAGNLPSFNTRFSCAKSFSEYVLRNAGFSFLEAHQ